MAYYRTQSLMLWCQTDLDGHMEKQETEMKQKLETKMGLKKNAPITGAIFFHSVFSH